METMHLKLLHLYYFKTLVENEYLKESADLLNISAPALSAIISNFEKELGMPLFDRVGRHNKLNKNGELVYNHTCSIIEEINKMRAELDSLKKRNHR